MRCFVIKILLVSTISFLVLSSCHIQSSGKIPYDAIDNNKSRTQSEKTEKKSEYALILLPTQNKMQLLDMMVNRVGFSISTGHNPVDLDVTPDGRRILVINSQDGTISSYFKEDNQNIQFLGSIGSGINPSHVIFNNKGTEAFVTYEGSNRIAVLQILNREKPNIKKIINLKDNESKLALSPYKLAISSDDNILFVIDKNSGKVFSFKSENDQFIQDKVFILSDSEKIVPEDMIFNENKLYISDSNNSQVLVFDTKESKVTSKILIKNQDTQISDFIPTKMVLNEKTGKLYVINEGLASVVVLDTKNNTMIKNILLSSGSKTDSAEPTDISINVDGTILYVTNAGGRNLSMISTKNDELIRNIGTTESVGNLPVLSAIKIL